MLNQKSSGLHPDAQRLLWALTYKRMQSFEDRRPWRQLEQRGFIRRLDIGKPGEKHWEVTPAGEAELLVYAQFPDRSGMYCPPKD